VSSIPFSGEEGNRFSSTFTLTNQRNPLSVACRRPLQFFGIPVSLSPRLGHFKVTSNESGSCQVCIIPYACRLVVLRQPSADP